jgi:hypothetical protein
MLLIASPVPASRSTSSGGRGLTIEDPVSDAMPGLPPVSGALEALGFGPEHSLNRTAAPVVLRGNNLVLAAPPAPGYALPVIGAALSRPPEPPDGLVMLLVPEAALDTWVLAVAPLARAAGRRAVAGPNPTRAAHHLGAGTPDLLVTTAPVLTELFRRSALDPRRIACIGLVWPELELSDETFVPVFADLPKDAVRIVITADPAATAALVERHAWRAASVGPLGGAAPAPAARHLRVATVGWDRRLEAVADLVDLLDQDRVAVWTAGRSAHSGIQSVLDGRGVQLELVDQAVPPSGFVVCYDAPPPELLGQLGSDAVLLAPPEVEPYLSRWVERAAPLPLRGPADPARREMESEREAIRTRLQSGLDRGSLLTLGPLFERFSPTAVAIALHGLWTSARSGPPPAAERPISRLPAASAPRSKVWLSVGKKDGVALGEILSLLTFDLGIGRDRLGRVDLKETFSLVEFDSEASALDAVARLAGRTLKGRRITARLDRGRDGPRERAPRGG